MIKFLFFAQLAEYADCDSIQIPYIEDKPASDYVAILAERLPKQAIETLQDGATMISINQRLASWNDLLADGDEVGLLPPFSGG